MTRSYSSIDLIVLMLILTIIVSLAIPIFTRTKTPTNGEARVSRDAARWSASLLEQGTVPLLERNRR